MNDDGFVPWRDDAFCERESAYALFNKVSWFMGRRPSELVRGRVREPRHHMGFDAPQHWVARLIAPAVPSVHGRPLAETLVCLAQRLHREVPAPWRRRLLAYCPQCMSRGVHLRLHQHMAVACCPVHPRQRLRSQCPQCTSRLAFGFGQRQGAFSCWMHGHLLMSDKGGGLVTPLARQARRLALVDQAQGWLDVLHDRLPLDDTRLGPESQEQDRLRPGLALEAVLRSMATVPAWVVRTDIPARLALRPRAAPGVTDKAGSARGKARVAQAQDEGMTACVSRMRHGLRIAARQFLIHYGRSHTCLDQPYHLLGHWLRLDADDVRLLQCCPVAIGFWLWRLRWGTAHAALLHAPSFLHNAPALHSYRYWLPVLVRSHLDLCLVTARHAVRAGRQGRPAQSALQTLRGLLDDAWDPACAVPAALTASGVTRSGSLQWEVDLVEAQASASACANLQPGQPGWLGPATSMSCDTALPGRCPPTWPFTPMRHDWIFLHPRPVPWAAPAQKAPAVASERGSAAAGPWACLPLDLP